MINNKNKKNTSNLQKIIQQGQKLSKVQNEIQKTETLPTDQIPLVFNGFQINEPRAVEQENEDDQINSSQINSFQINEPRAVEQENEDDQINSSQINSFQINEPRAVEQENEDDQINKLEAYKIKRQAQLLDKKNTITTNYNGIEILLDQTKEEEIISKEELLELEEIDKKDLISEAMDALECMNYILQKKEDPTKEQGRLFQFEMGITKRILDEGNSFFDLGEIATSRGYVKNYSNSLYINRSLAFRNHKLKILLSSYDKKLLSILYKLLGWIYHYDCPLTRSEDLWEFLSISIDLIQGLMRNEKITYTDQKAYINLKGELTKLPMKLCSSPLLSLKPLQKEIENIATYLINEERELDNKLKEEQRLKIIEQNIKLAEKKEEDKKRTEAQEKLAVEYAFAQLQLEKQAKKRAKKEEEKQKNSDKKSNAQIADQNIDQDIKNDISAQTQSIIHKIANQKKANKKEEPQETKTRSTFFIFSKYKSKRQKEEEETRLKKTEKDEINNDSLLGKRKNSSEEDKSSKKKQKVDNDDINQNQNDVNYPEVQDHEMKDHDHLKEYNCKSMFD